MDDMVYKFRCKTCVCPKAQRGAALLLLLLITVVAASSIFVTTLRQSTTQIALDKNRKTRDALARAKEALIGYALVFSEQPPASMPPTPPGSQPQGFLPCPDTDGNGMPNPPCGSGGQGFIGRLPWRVLGIPPLRDGDGECLWYAVSGNYKNNPKVSLTSDTDGQFIVKDSSGTVVVGASPPDQAIAIVFAPGAPFGGQNRGVASLVTLTECGSTNSGDPVNQPTNYLDAFGGINNATGSPALPTTAPSVFVSSPGQMIPDFNDTLLLVTPQNFAPVYERMDRWVANRVRQCVTAYGSPYPWAAALNVPPATDPPDFDDDSNQRFGRIPDDLTNSGGGSWPQDPNDTTRQCLNVPGGTPDWSWWWWNTWKEMVFYAVDADYAPTGTATGTPAMQLIDTVTPTPPGPTSPPSQFVVMTAGRKLSGQNRASAADKADITNYLEDHNNPAYAGALPPPLSAPYSPGTGGPGNIPTGDEQFVAAPVTSTAPYNDTACNNAACP